MPPPQRPRSMPTRGRSPPPEPERPRPRPHSALGIPTNASRLVADIHDPWSRLPPDIRLYHQYQFALAGETLACGGYAHSTAIAEEARRAGWVNPHTHPNTVRDEPLHWSYQALSLGWMPPPPRSITATPLPRLQAPDTARVRTAAPPPQAVLAGTSGPIGRSPLRLIPGAALRRMTPVKCRPPLPASPVPTVPLSSHGISSRQSSPGPPTTPPWKVPVTADEPQHTAPDPRARTPSQGDPTRALLPTRREQLVLRARARAARRAHVARSPGPTTQAPRPCGRTRATLRSRRPGAAQPRPQPLPQHGPRPARDSSPALRRSPPPAARAPAPSTPRSPGAGSRPQADVLPRLQRTLGTPRHLHQLQPSEQSPHEVSQPQALAVPTVPHCPKVLRPVLPPVHPLDSRLNESTVRREGPRRPHDHSAHGGKRSRAWLRGRDAPPQLSFSSLSARFSEARSEPVTKRTREAAAPLRSRFINPMAQGRRPRPPLAHPAATSHRARQKLPHIRCRKKECGGDVCFL